MPVRLVLAQTFALPRVHSFFSVSLRYVSIRSSIRGTSPLYLPAINLLSVPAPIFRRCAILEILRSFFCIKPDSHCNLSSLTGWTVPRGLNDNALLKECWVGRVLLQKPLGKRRRILCRPKSGFVNKVRVVVDVVEATDGEQVVCVDLRRERFV